MTEEEMADTFKKYSDEELLLFDRVKNKSSGRADLHAFLLLDKLCPGTVDIVGGAEHDEIFLDIELSTLAEKITETQVIELLRCGVMYSNEYGGLYMFA